MKDTGSFFGCIGFGLSIWAGALGVQHVETAHAPPTYACREYIEGGGVQQYLTFEEAKEQCYEYVRN